jgi:hypothetical protein
MGALLFYGVFDMFDDRATGHQIVFKPATTPARQFQQAKRMNAKSTTSTA